MNDGSSVEIRLHFPSQGKVKIEMSVPSGRRRAKLHLSLAFDYSNLHIRKEKDRNNKCCFGLFGPSVEIRTRGLLNPIQARYQTSPHPDIHPRSHATEVL